MVHGACAFRPAVPAAAGCLSLPFSAGIPGQAVPARPLCRTPVRPSCAPAGNRVSQGSPHPKGVLMSLASRGAEFFRFCIVGGLTFLVDYGLLFLLTSVLDVHYLWSSAWAFIVAVMDTSNAVKLMLNTTNTTSSGRMPRYVSTLRGLAE